MNDMQDEAYKLGCGRLLFAHGAIRCLGEEARRLGHSAYLLGGPHAMAQVQDAMEASLRASAIRYSVDVYEGPCSEEKAEDIAWICREQGAELLIGAGGGRIMDLVKMAAETAHLPVITIPTISATCAAYTPLSVVYTPEGACRGTWYFRREVDCLICDLDILCTQKPRYLAAGILDAMAKHVEITHHQFRMENAGQDVCLARLVARNLYEDLLALGTKALQGDAQAIERCVFHVIVTTGLVSGMARGRYQSALAHAVYEAIRTCYTEQSRPWLHGEVVAVGLLLQARYLGEEAMADELLGLMQAAGMPTGFRQIGVDGDLEALAAHDPVPRYYLHGKGDAQTLACLMAEA